MESVAKHLRRGIKKLKRLQYPMSTWIISRFDGKEKREAFPLARYSYYILQHNDTRKIVTESPPIFSDSDAFASLEKCMRENFRVGGQHSATIIIQSQSDKRIARYSAIISEYYR